MIKLLLLTRQVNSIAINRAVRITSACSASDSGRMIAMQQKQAVTSFLYRSIFFFFKETCCDSIQLLYLFFCSNTNRHNLPFPHHRPLALTLPFPSKNSTRENFHQQLTKFNSNNYQENQ